MKNNNEQRTEDLLKSYAQRRPVATTSRALAALILSFVLTISLSKHARAQQTQTPVAGTQVKGVNTGP